MDLDNAIRKDIPNMDTPDSMIDIKTDENPELTAMASPTSKAPSSASSEKRKDMVTSKQQPSEKEKMSSQSTVPPADTSTGKPLTTPRKRASVQNGGGRASQQSRTAGSRKRSALPPEKETSHPSGQEYPSSERPEEQNVQADLSSSPKVSDAASSQKGKRNRKGSISETAPRTDKVPTPPPAEKKSAVFAVQPVDDTYPSGAQLLGALPDSPAMREILEHGQRVAGYADILFRELHSLHGLSPEWGNRLHLAACLHDLGWMEGRKGHHKTSMRIIDEDLSLPIADEDRPWVALLARYHRKAVPSRKHSRFAMLKRSQQEALRKAAALLRLADALDYSHRGIIKDFTVIIDKNRVTLQTVCTDDCTGEITRCQKKGLLFTRVFGKEPKLVCLE